MKRVLGVLGIVGILVFAYSVYHLFRFGSDVAFVNNKGVDILVSDVYFNVYFLFVVATLILIMITLSGIGVRQCWKLIRGK